MNSTTLASGKGKTNDATHGVTTKNSAGTAGIDSTKDAEKTGATGSATNISNSATGVGSVSGTATETGGATPPATDASQGGKSAGSGSVSPTAVDTNEPHVTTPIPQTTSQSISQAVPQSNPTGTIGTDGACTCAPQLKK